MKRALVRAVGVSLLLASLGLLYLTNTGLLSLDKPYVYRFTSELPSTAQAVAFSDVNIIPMDSERVLPAQTVLVRAGLIEQIRPTGQVQVPRDALVVDGAGKYLMPGLVDMHVHIMNANDLLLFVANGVTTVRNMWGKTDAMLALGFPEQLALRKAILTGDLFGPTIYTTGLVMEGEPKTHPLMTSFTSAAQARESVAWQAARGYDLIKVYDYLDAEVYRAIMEAAQGRGMPVVGHVPFAVGIDNVLAGGQLTIEHLTGYIDPDAARFLIPEDQLDVYAVRTRESGVWNVPTLSLYPKNSVSPERLKELKRQLGLQYLSPGRRALNGFNYSQMSRGHESAGESYPETIAELNLAMTRALHQAGAGILLGTDALNPYQIPGYSAHEEMAYLVRAGLSPYEALRAGTHDAALVLGSLDEFGTVSEGKRADLLQVDANPLDDVTNAGKIRGVMVRGRWIPRSQLQSILDGLKASFEPSLLERLWPLGLIALASLAVIRSSSTE
jgi:imidazolonepropionase-like amidohydrolase